MWKTTISVQTLAVGNKKFFLAFRLLITQTGKKVHVRPLLHYCLGLWEVLYCTQLNQSFCFKFYCSNNMLYPKEDKQNRVLLYAVRTSIQIQEFNLIHCDGCLYGWNPSIYWFILLWIWAVSLVPRPKFSSKHYIEISLCLWHWASIRLAITHQVLVKAWTTNRPTQFCHIELVNKSSRSPVVKGWQFKRGMI